MRWHQKEINEVIEDGAKTVITGMELEKLSLEDFEEYDSFLKIGVFSNKPLLGAFVLTFALQMAIIYVPFLNPIFKTEPLTFNELVFTLALSSVVFFAVEIEKLIRRKKHV